MYTKGQRSYECQRYRSKRTVNKKNNKSEDFARKILQQLIISAAILIVVSGVSKINLPIIQSTNNTIGYYLKFSNDFKTWYNNAYNFIIEKTAKPVEDSTAEQQNVIDQDQENNQESSKNLDQEAGELTQ